MQCPTSQLPKNDADREDHYIKNAATFVPRIGAKQSRLMLAHS